MVGFQPSINTTDNMLTLMGKDVGSDTVTTCMVSKARKEYTD